jgi:hypothetical protein
MLSSCVAAVLSDRHASTSVISTVGLGGLNAGKAAAAFSALKLAAFLGEALWSCTGRGILEEDEGVAIVNKAFALESGVGVF